MSSETFIKMDLVDKAVGRSGAAASQGLTVLETPAITIDAHVSTKSLSEQDRVAGTGNGTEPAGESEKEANPVAEPEIINLPRQATPYALSGGVATEVFPEPSGMGRVFRGPGHPLTYARRHPPPSSAQISSPIEREEHTRGLVSQVLQAASLLTLLAEMEKDALIVRAAEDIAADDDSDRSPLRVYLTRLIEGNDESQSNEDTSNPLTGVNDEEETEDKEKEEPVAHRPRAGTMYLLDTNFLYRALFPEMDVEEGRIEQLGEGSSVDKSEEVGEPRKKERKGKSKNKKKKKKQNKDPSPELDHDEDQGTGSVFPSESPASPVSEKDEEEARGEAKEVQPTEDQQHLHEGGRERALTSASTSLTPKKRKGRKAKKWAKNTGPIGGQQSGPEREKASASLSESKLKEGSAYFIGDQRSEHDHDVAATSSSGSRLKDGNETPKNSDKEDHPTKYQRSDEKREGEQSPFSDFKVANKYIKSNLSNLNNVNESARSSDNEAHAIQGQPLEKGRETAAVSPPTFPARTRKNKKAKRREQKLRQQQAQDAHKKGQRMEEDGERTPMSPLESTRLMVGVSSIRSSHNVDPLKDVETPPARLDQASNAILRAINPCGKVLLEVTEASSVHGNPSAVLSVDISQAVVGASDAREVETTDEDHFQDALEELVAKSDVEQSGNLHESLDDHNPTERDIALPKSEEHATEETQVGEGAAADAMVMEPIAPEPSVVHGSSSGESEPEDEGLSGQIDYMNMGIALSKRSKSLTELELTQFVNARQIRFEELVSEEAVESPVQLDQAGSSSDATRNNRSDSINFLRERTASKASPSEKEPSALLRRNSGVRSQELILEAVEVEDVEPGLGHHDSADPHGGITVHQDIRKDKKDITTNAGRKLRMNPLAKEFVPAPVGEASPAARVASISHPGLTWLPQGSVCCPGHGEIFDPATEDASTQERSVTGAEDTPRPSQIKVLQPNSSPQLEKSKHHKNIISNQNESATMSFHPQRPAAATPKSTTGLTESSDESPSQQDMDFETVSQKTEPAHIEGSLATDLNSMSLESDSSHSDEKDQPQTAAETSSNTVESDTEMVTPDEGTSQPVEQRIIKFSDLQLKCLWCQKIVSEDDETVVLCNGCGPFSHTRYCSELHMFFDHTNHWKLCNDMSFPFHVDPKSLPEHYKQYCPAIDERHGRYNFWRHRQRAHSTYRHDEADYAIFSDFRQSQKAGVEVKTMVPTTNILWYDDQVTKDVFNRILNLCFFDNDLIRPVLLLYRLVRMVLIDEDEWDEELEEELSHQFWCEFNLDARGMTCEDDEDDDGKIWEEWHGENDQGGVKHICEEYENRHPILRLWRREHPDRSLSKWDRFEGKGFPNALPRKTLNGFSAGWNGPCGETRPWLLMAPVSAAD